MEKREIQSRELSWCPDKNGKFILENVSMEFEQGGFYGIIGPNGSGKTSFLRHLLRFLKAERGKLLLGDKDLTEYHRKELAKNLAFVPQNTKIDTDFTAYEIVMMGRNPYRERFSGRKRKDEEIVEQAMRLASCDALKDHTFRYLSGGEAQRVLIARAIAQDTPWLLLDEPVSSLDIRHQMEIMDTLLYLNKEKGKSIILVLHDLNLASRFCSHLVMMKNGKIKAAGQTKELMKVELLKEVYDMEFVSMVHPKIGCLCYFPL